MPPELAQTPVAVVCAGAKAILDLPATLEWLETWGVPVVGYDHGGVGEQLQLLHSRGLVGLGDLEGLLRQCRSALGMGRIALASSPPTLEHMLSDTLAVYESFF